MKNIQIPENIGKHCCAKIYQTICHVTCLFCVQVFHQIFLHLIGNIFAFKKENSVSAVKPMFSDVGDKETFLRLAKAVGLKALRLVERKVLTSCELIFIYSPSC